MKTWPEQIAEIIKDIMHDNYSWLNDSEYVRYLIAFNICCGIRLALNEPLFEDAKSHNQDDLVDKVVNEMQDVVRKCGVRH